MDKGKKRVTVITSFDGKGRAQGTPAAKALIAEVMRPTDFFRFNDTRYRYREKTASINYYFRHLVTTKNHTMNDDPAPLFDPAAIPQVALESMNQTHREEVELINRLAALLMAGSQGKVDAAAITATVTDWVIHTREHFKRENDLMKRHGFPAYPVHREEHDRVLSQIEGLRHAWLDKQQCGPLIEFIFTQWPQWFSNHVNSMDRVTAQFIAVDRE